MYCLITFVRSNPISSKLFLFKCIKFLVVGGGSWQFVRLCTYLCKRHIIIYVSICLHIFGPTLFSFLFACYFSPIFPVFTEGVMCILS